MIGRKKEDATLGKTMVELRDTYAKLSSAQQTINGLAKENEELRQAIDHRGCYDRIEELELELADYKGVQAARYDREQEANRRVAEIEEKMFEMRERVVAILTDSLEQLGR